MRGKKQQHTQILLKLIDFDEVSDFLDDEWEFNENFRWKFNNWWKKSWFNSYNLNSIDLKVAWVFFFNLSWYNLDYELLKKLNKQWIWKNCIIGGKIFFLEM
jgi:hypothetical protein